MHKLSGITYIFLSILLKLEGCNILLRNKKVPNLFINKHVCLHKYRNNNNKTKRLI